MTGGIVEKITEFAKFFSDLGLIFDRFSCKYYLKTPRFVTDSVENYEFMNFLIILFPHFATILVRKFNYLNYYLNFWVNGSKILIAYLFYYSNLRSIRWENYRPNRLQIPKNSMCPRLFILRPIRPEIFDRFGRKLFVTMCFPTAYFQSKICRKSSICDCFDGQIQLFSSSVYLIGISFLYCSTACSSKLRFWIYWMWLKIVFVWCDL